MNEEKTTPWQALKAFVDTLDKDRFKIEIDMDFDQDLVVYEISETGRGVTAITFCKEDPKDPIMCDGSVLVLLGVYSFCTE